MATCFEIAYLAGAVALGATFFGPWGAAIGALIWFIL